MRRKSHARPKVYRRRGGRLPLLLYNRQKEAEGVKQTVMSQLSVCLPHRPKGPGIEDPDCLALRAPSADRPPDLPGFTVQSVYLPG